MKTQVIGLALGLVGCNEGVDFRSKSLDQTAASVLFDQEFDAARITPKSLTYQPLYGLLTEDLTLKEKPLLSSEMKQLERPVNMESYVQGYDGDSAIQEFDISSAGKLDLLLVIDNSGSMGEEQAELSTNLKSLIKSLDKVDWQIGIITTDTCRLQNARVAGHALRKGDPSVDSNFETTIKGLGTAGSRDEQGIKTALQQISGKCVGSPNSWLRSDASLAVFFVSDEQNECFGDPLCADDQGVKWGPEQMITQMNAMRRADQLKAYALLWNKDSSTKPSRNALCRRDAGVETYGSMYSQVIDAVGGLERSICLDSNVNTNDYGHLLEQISSDVNRSVQREFTLQQEPVAGSLEILVDGVPARDVQVVGRKVLLKNALDTQIKLRVTYKHDAVPKFDRVRLKDRPALETLDIKVENKKLEPANIVYDEQTGELIFLNAPLDKERVNIRYRSRAVLPNKFDVKPIVSSAGPIATVAVNGRITNDWTIAENGAQVVFEEAPLDGSILTFSYLAKDPKITTYKIPEVHDITFAKSIVAKDKFTGDTVPMTVYDDHFEFDAEDVQNGRQLWIVYDYGKSMTFMKHRLPHDPLPNTIEVSSQNSTEDCIENVKVEGKDVSFQCSEDSLDDVTISFKYVEERFSTFKMSDLVRDMDFVKVFVDGVQITQFNRTGRSITIPADLLKLDSKVRIIAIANEQ